VENKMSSHEKLVFENELRKLEGSECWSVIAGVGTGSRVTLDFGRKIKRSTPLTNPTLSEQARHFRGEFAIFIEDCSWRLEKNDAVLCTSKSDNQDGGELIKSIASLVGTKVSSIIASSPASDLQVELSGGYFLRTFSDCSLQEDDGDNVTLFTPNYIISVEAKGILSIKRN